MSTDLTSIMTTLSEDFNTKLHSKLTSTQIPIFPIVNPEDERASITIFVSPQPQTLSKKYKKSHKRSTMPLVDIRFSEDLQFDISKLNKSDIIKLELIWHIIKPEYLSKVLTTIKFWSHSLFKVAQSFCDETSTDISVMLFPFRMFIGEDCSNMHVSKLPSFEDIRLCDLHSPQKIFNGNDFLKSQANGIIEASKAFEQYQSYVKNSSEIKETDSKS